MFKRIYIELSNYCNLNCFFCTPKDKNNRILSFEQFEHIFNQVKNHTNEVCLHILGEPTIHPDFIRIVKLINEQNIKVMISTNGKELPNLMDNLLSVKIDTWNISLHSTYYLEEESRDKFIIDLISFIDLYQNKYTSNFNLRLWADSNEKIHKNNEEIKKLLFKSFNYNGEIKDRIRLHERVILSYEKEFEWPSLESNEYSDGYCLGGKTHIGILANGEVTICCLDGAGVSGLGNIFNTSLDEILTGEKYQNAVKGFRDNKCYLELCKHCTYKRRS